MHGFDTYDFSLPKNTFYNSTLNEENAGFCDNNDCLGNGVHNISRCFEGNKLAAIQTQMRMLHVICVEKVYPALFLSRIF